MAEREMKVTQAQMAEARLDLAYRDYCAHLLIPLNRCRRRTVSHSVDAVVLAFFVDSMPLSEAFRTFITHRSSPPPLIPLPPASLLSPGLFVRLDETGIPWRENARSLPYLTYVCR